MLVRYAGIEYVCAGAMLAGASFGQTSALVPASLSGGELKWQAQPNGNYRADLAGDDKKAGLYAYRVKFPPKLRNQSHFHPDHRIVTVMSVTFYVGFGDQFDEAALKP